MPNLTRWSTTSGRGTGRSSRSPLREAARTKPTLEVGKSNWFNSKRRNWPQRLFLAFELAQKGGERKKSQAAAKFQPGPTSFICQFDMQNTCNWLTNELDRRRARNSPARPTRGTIARNNTNERPERFMNWLASRERDYNIIRLTTSSLFVARVASHVSTRRSRLMNRRRTGAGQLHSAFDGGLARPSSVAFSLMIVRAGRS